MGKLLCLSIVLVTGLWAVLGCGLGWAGLGCGLGWAGLEMAGVLSGVLPLRGPVGGHTDCVTTNTTSTFSVSAHTFVCLKIETLHLVHQVPRDEDYIFYQTRTT